MKIKIYIVVMLSTILSFASAQTITVRTDNVIKTFDHNPTGINLNYLMDDDSFLKPSVLLKQSLLNMKIGMLRFPGGEKADNYLWSIPPYSGVNPHFATKVNWINKDSRFSSDQITPLTSTMDFDEFMDICQITNAKPIIVVAGDAQYCKFSPDPPTLKELITNAEEWVRYANIKKKQKIKYWMIGNESWNKAAYDKPSSATEYANDFVLFSKAMKAIDPNIMIVANSKPGKWLDTLLMIANGYVDAIAISNYPCWNWTKGYEVFRIGNPSFVSDVNSVIRSIGDRDIGVIVSEYNSLDFEKKGWKNKNDLAHAIVNFQMFGDQIKLPKVLDAYLWNTRWIKNESTPQELSDAIDSKGNLNAIGKALSLWGNNILDEIVESNNEGFINSFATTNTKKNKLNVFLINRDTVIHKVSLRINGYFNDKRLPRSINVVKFTGDSLSDEFPVIQNPSKLKVLGGNVISIDLVPYSINVVKLVN